MRRDRVVSVCASRNRDTPSQLPASWSPTSATIRPSRAASASRNTSPSSTSLAIGLHPSLVEELCAELLGVAQLVGGELLGYLVEQRGQEWGDEVPGLPGVGVQAGLEQAGPDG